MISKWVSSVCIIRHPVIIISSFLDSRLEKVHEVGTRLLVMLLFLPKTVLTTFHEVSL